jgi:hypothetical protein
VTVHVTLGPGAPALRRQVGPTAWAVLEVLIGDSEPDGHGAVVARTTAVRLAQDLGIGRDVAVAALGALRREALIAFIASRDPGTGRFGPGTYVIRPDALRCLTAGLWSASDRKGRTGEGREASARGEQLSLLRNATPANNSSEPPNLSNPFSDPHCPQPLKPLPLSFNANRTADLIQRRHELASEMRSLGGPVGRDRTGNLTEGDPRC